ncbi:MAG: esterase-like activity of phytase family protein [Alphaproteobacteria bacterium]|nr:esterase-like activity of phytase family protein [Alphaproteobacteria bacterium]MDE2013444.1 esterase-like activity of phytase family protein [Alphaproteobacteria bacterium]MDE2073295.1 esterase-like activity of phytase family protein [Alphaproteobacteria bacterium]
MRRAASLLSACALALSLSLAACATESPAAAGLKDAVTVDYRPIPLSLSDPHETRVGEFIWRGGLQLTSPDARFGGWSGLIVSADGQRMLSQSDEAHWLRADLVYGKNGDLVGISHAQLADMLDDNGHTMNKEHGDAEGLDALTPSGPDGAVAVSFERDVRSWSYDLSRSLDLRPMPIPLPDGVHVLDGSNQGLEGLALLKPHALLAVSEAPHDKQGEMDAWLVPYDGKAPGVSYGALSIIRHPPYEISDAAMGPERKYLYLLERHYFGPIGGIVIAVRRIPAAEVKAGARLGGEEIARFTMHENIDNMEGLALRRGADGKTYLYMISDDNYNHAFQRTLLMMFELNQ